MKNLKFKILLIVSLLSVVFSILNYYDIIRDLELELYSNDHFLKKYKKLKKIKDTPKFVISLDTHISNLKNIKPVINSLLDQSYKVDQIIVNTTNNETLDDYPTLKNIITLNNITEPKFKLMAILPVLESEYEGDAIIIGVDDTKIYGKDFVENIYTEMSKNNQGLIVNDNIYVIKPEFFSPESLADTKTVNWLENNIQTPFKYVSYEYNRNFK